MIPKVSSGSNYYGLLAYLEKKPNTTYQTPSGLEVVAGSVRIDAGNFFTTGISSAPILADKNDLSTAFQSWDGDGGDVRFKNKVAHFSLSFSPFDTIEQNKTITIAKDFLKQMGYESSPYVIYQHNDKHHNHIHIVTSRVGEDGKKIAHDFEARKAIQICREVETAFRLTKVEPLDKKQNVLDTASEKLIKASTETPFKNTVLLNLQYFLNNKRVADIDTLIKSLAGQGISMQLHDKDGNRLPKNGVRFYYKQDNKIISYLSGKDLQKGFYVNLVKKLERNAQTPDIAVKQAEKVIPTLKPSYQVLKTIGPAIADVLEKANSSVLITHTQMTELLNKVNIKPEYTFNKSGQLKGLAFVYGEARFKASDIGFKGIKLSAAQFAPYICNELSGKLIADKAIQYCKEFDLKTAGEGLTKDQFHEVLKRNHLHLNETNKGTFLQLNQLGSKLQVDLSKYPDGVQAFFKAAALKPNENPLLSFDQLTTINKLKPLTVNEKIVYTAVLSGDIKKIQEVSQIQVHLSLSANEQRKIGKNVETLNYYNATQNRIQRSADYVKYLTQKKQKAPGLNEIVFALNLRGVAVIPEFKNIEGEDGRIEKQLSNIKFQPLLDPNKDLPALNFFQINETISAEKWKLLWEETKGDTNTVFYNKTEVPGLYFDIDKDVTEMFITAETDPGLIQDCKFSLEHPYLDSNIEYLESLEPDNYLYTYPGHETYALSTIFRDYGRMTNRGADSDIFKKLKRRIYRK